MRRILDIGMDKGLLRSRAAVLESAHAEVVSHYGPDLEVGEDDEFDLLVLCHSIPEKSRLSLIVDAHRRWPGVRILQISDSEFDPAPSLKYVDRVTVWGSPAQLIAAAKELLETGGTQD